MPLLLVGVLGLLLSALTGCVNPTCKDNQSALPLMGFYDSATGQSVTINSINFGGVGAPGDSLLIVSGESNSQVYLPFRADATSTAFYINYVFSDESLNTTAWNDTITFHYTASPYFASSECGAMYQYLISSVDCTHHIVDSVAVVDPLITNVESERIKIYFRTSAADDDNSSSTDSENDSDEDPEEGDEA
jgi:hypothetical protein